MATVLSSSVPSDTDSDPRSPSPSPSSPDQPLNEEPHDNNSHSQPSSSQLLSLAFSSDRQFFSACTRGGLRTVFRCEPFGEDFRHHTGGAIRAADTLCKPRTWAVIGDGSHPKFPENNVILWSCEQSRVLCVLECSSAVLSVRIRHDLVVIVTERRVVVFQLFPDLRQIRSINTVPNPAGLCAVAEGVGEKPATEVMAVLGMRDGWVRVEHCSKGWESCAMAAHESKIACLGLTQDGQFLATASAKGTLVRVFRTTDGVLLQEVRRGVSRAEIHCLAFSETAQWLAVSSDKGTVHVFSLNVKSSASTLNNKSPTTTLSAAATSSISSSLAFIKGVIPKYFNPGLRSVAKFRLPHDASKSIVAFGHVKDTIIVLGNNGSFYRCQFDPVKGGNMTQLERHNFLNPSEF